MKETLTGIAVSAISILITVLAIYLSLRLLGKIAKFIVAVVLVAFLVWLFVADNSILNVIKDFIK